MGGGFFPLMTLHDASWRLMTVHEASSLRRPVIMFYIEQFMQCWRSFNFEKKQAGIAASFEALCSDCPDWDECSGCTITSDEVTSTCKAPLEHTSADEPGLTLETLNVDGGYWRTTSNSVNILECYNPGACSGGVTGVDSFCASGYTGPCEGVRQ